MLNLQSRHIMEPAIFWTQSVLKESLHFSANPIKCRLIPIHWSIIKLLSKIYCQFGFPNYTYINWFFGKFMLIRMLSFLSYWRFHNTDSRINLLKAIKLTWTKCWTDSNNIPYIFLIILIFYWSTISIQ
jgi:hypothetical protein